MRDLGISSVAEKENYYFLYVVCPWFPFTFDSSTQIFQNKQKQTNRKKKQQPTNKTKSTDKKTMVYTYNWKPSIIDNYRNDN